ncbi:hypothetical protein LAZ67_10003289 [Cordylochernes scorpioides]|uniref:Uncharacterized protein n=1 Tax=Cordylochernes scorpioides TaxID=51811 RepID=A0ABY6L0J4_9ARAC|nr:hypothetical protein LAZ67_10003289 [Cordylochernes scorpioides]
MPPDEIITPRRRGPEPGMTREMREERDRRLRETEEEELIKRGDLLILREGGKPHFGGIKDWERDKTWLHTLPKSV